MASSIEIWNTTSNRIKVSLEWSLVFDLFQLLVILTSLCGGIFLLLLIPLIRKNNILTVWTIILLGFLHEFYSVLVLIMLKLRADPEMRVCVDSQEISTKIAVFIMCLFITSALQKYGTSWRSLICTSVLWMYVLSVLAFTSDRTYSGRNSSFNMSLISDVHLHLTSCGNQSSALRFIASDYAILYLPILVLLILIRTWQNYQDCRFWDIQMIQDCYSGGLCSSCLHQNQALQIVLVYLSGTLYIVRPVIILYNFINGGLYYDVVLSIVLVGTYCFLCLDTFSSLRKKCILSNYRKNIKIIL